MTVDHSVLATAVADTWTAGSDEPQEGRTSTETFTVVCSLSRLTVTCAPGRVTERARSPTRSRDSPLAAARAAARAASTHSSCTPTAWIAHSAAASTIVSAGSIAAVSAVTEPRHADHFLPRGIAIAVGVTTSLTAEGFLSSSARLQRAIDQ